MDDPEEEPIPLGTSGSCDQVPPPFPGQSRAAVARGEVKESRNLMIVDLTPFRYE
jgi:hypothetical protein